MIGDDGSVLLTFSQFWALDVIHSLGFFPEKEFIFMSMKLFCHNHRCHHCVTFCVCNLLVWAPHPRLQNVWTASWKHHCHNEGTCFVMLSVILTTYCWPNVVIIIIIIIFIIIVIISIALFWLQRVDLILSWSLYYCYHYHNYCSH